MEVFPKYLIIEGKLYLQKCTYHKEILERYLKYNEVEHEKEITPAGGGWFLFSSDGNDIILHGHNFVKELRKIMFEQDYTILSPCVLQPEKNQCYWKTVHNWGATEVRDVKWVDFQAPMIHRRFLDKMEQFPNELIYGWGQDALSGMVCEENNWKVGVVDWLPIIHFSALTYRSEKSNLTISEYSQNAERAMLQYFQQNGKWEKYLEFREASSTYNYNK